MIEWRASAPGKMVVAGEYAVLEGHRALGLAVTRRASARLRIDHAGPSQLKLDPISRESIDWPLDNRDRSPELAQAIDLIASAWKQWGPSGCLDSFFLEINTRALFNDHNAKLGLGSSSAVAVLLSGLARQLAKEHSQDPEFIEGADTDAELREWHHRLWRLHQGGQGSGLDLATALTGGLIAYTQPSSSDTNTNAQAQWSSLNWPQGLYGLVVWTGESASTPDMLKAYRDWRSRSPEQFDDVVGGLGRCANSLIEALQAGDVDAFIEGFTAYGGRMGTMGGLIERPIVTPAHAAVAELARKRHVGYKPCGAGGGDIGLMLSKDAKQLVHLTGAIEAMGMSSIELEIDANGWELGTGE